MALYGLKSLGAAWKSFLADMLDSIGFKISIDDPDVWIRAATKPTGETYYEYILWYVDDVLCISHDDRQTIGETHKNVNSKNNNIEDPDFYSCASLKKKEPNGQTMWTMARQDYIKTATENLENKLKKKGIKLNARAGTPM